MTYRQRDRFNFNRGTETGDGNWVNNDGAVTFSGTRAYSVPAGDDAQITRNSVAGLTINGGGGRSQEVYLVSNGGMDTWTTCA